MPTLELEPELIFFGVLPPLLYSAAFFTSLRDLRVNARPIGLLAIGLIVLTTVGVAVVAHALIDGLTWPSAFVLGAIVSSTDPIAATAIARRLGVPRRLVTVVEGESLVNDGTGLVLYRVAVAAVVAGSFSAVYTGGLSVVSAVGGVAVGLGVGWIVRQIRQRLDNPPAEITISLLTGYFAFIPAELLGVSAVLSAVAAGVYLGWYTPELTSSQVRLQGVAVWEIVQYMLNALLFLLVGLQLPVVVDALGDIPSARLLGYAALVSATVIALRFVCYPAATTASSCLPSRTRARVSPPSSCRMPSNVSAVPTLPVPAAASVSGSRSWTRSHARTAGARRRRIVRARARSSRWSFRLIAISSDPHTLGFENDRRRARCRRS